MFILKGSQNSQQKMYNCYNAINQGVHEQANLKALTFFKAFTIGTWDVHEVTLDGQNADKSALP